jgi:glycosyltransferase involved in cell wall biosynthesis
MMSNRRSICLSMIVKNEADVITRCLASVLPLIDYWIICDTGSTDGTRDAIRNFFAEHGKPGELHERPWKDFAHNRSEALSLSRPHADYTLIIDADDVLELSPGFKMPSLKADSYTIEIQHQELRYPRTQLVRAALPWRYEGVLHEFLTCGLDSNGNRIFSENLSQKALRGVRIRMTEHGARRRVSASVRFSRDAALLTAALATETDPFLIARYTFYLAQSYQDAGEKEKALENYLKRSMLGLWQQEIYFSLYQAAKLKAQLGHAADEVIEAYAAAARVDPRRAEALHAAARYCREHKRYQQGYDFAKRALRLHPPLDALFSDQSVYDYGVLDEYGVAAYWIGKYDECLKACNQLLRSGKSLPEGYRARIEANIRLAGERIRETRVAAKKNSPGSSHQRQVSDLDPPVKNESGEKPGLPEPVPASQQKRLMSNTLHVLGVPHTIPHEDYTVCAFTAKVLLFPEVIQPFGWNVIEYSNEGSASKAREHVVILRNDRLRALSRRRSREEPLDADVNNTELREEFQKVLLEKIRSRAKPGDIVCHVSGPNMDVYNLLRDCHHIEVCVGYTAWPGLPFRIYESSAWMHWHYGKAGQEDGNHYKWVIPSPIDVDIWDFCEEPDDYAVFLGRVTPRKGMNELVEIARRMPELPIHVYGPGDPSQWAKDAPPNLLFKGPVFGNKRVDVVRRARCMLMPTVFIEPFGNSGVEAQLCGVPLIGVSYGAFQETILDGVTGYRCHTLADWVEAIRLSKSLDRRKISTLARSKYSKQVVGQQYDWAFKQLADLSGRGWYADKSRKFASAAVLPQKHTSRKPN